MAIYGGAEKKQWFCVDSLVAVDCQIIMNRTEL